MEDFSEAYMDVLAAVLKTTCGGRPANTRESRYYLDYDSPLHVCLQNSGY